MIVLSAGYHADATRGLCAMEWCAWAAGERHTDRPRCVSPIIGGFVRCVNDSVSDAQRQLLIPVLLDCIGTNTSGRDEDRRLWLIVQWMLKPHRILVESVDALPHLFAWLASSGKTQYDHYAWIHGTIERVLMRRGLNAAEFAGMHAPRFRGMPDTLEIIRAMCAVGRNPIPLDEEAVRACSV